MSVQRAGCEQGWEPDMFSQNCAIPQLANVMLGACSLVIGIGFVASELFLRASATQSFADMDREKQSLLVLRGLYAATAVLTYGPLAYKRGEWDDGTVTRASIIVFICSGAWTIILAYRGLRDGFSVAFTLRKDLGQLLRNLSGARTVHLAVYVVVMARATWNMTDSRSSAARYEIVLSGMCVLEIPFVLFFGFATVMASKALQELPPTNQTVAIRKKLRAFKRAMLRDFVLCVICSFWMVLIATLLLEYCMLIWGIGCLAALLPGAAINLIKLLPRTKKQPATGTRNGQPRTLQIVPVASTTKLLREWESEGRQSDDPYQTNLPPGIQTFGVPGVSLALLKKLAEEDNIPADWTMTQVCAEVVKPQTRFGHQAKHAEVHCAYAALIGKAIDDKGRPYVGKATQFLSYAWKYSWKVVFTALELFEQRQAEAGAEPSYFFIDQFCLDQHEMSSTAHDATDEKYTEIVAKLQKSIEAPGRVLMLLHPWNQPIVLTRAW
jgi:hypothetical protein